MFLKQDWMPGVAKSFNFWNQPQPQSWKLIPKCTNKTSSKPENIQQSKREK